MRRAARYARGILEWYNDYDPANYGQVAQSVERSPEKAGVGGSIPSLATSSFQILTSIFVTEVCLSGVQMESKPL